MVKISYFYFDGFSMIHPSAW